MEDFISIKEFQQHAAEILSKDALGFYNSGATDEQTLVENYSNFKKWKFQPRILRDVSRVDTTTKVLGQKLAFPICIAPTSLLKMASKDGEIDAAKVTADLGTLYTLSSLATTSIEEVDSSVPFGFKWFQLYVFKDREVTRRLVQRAENNGFSALVLTVDLPALGKRYMDVRNKFSLPVNLTLKNFEIESAAENYEVEGDKESGMAEFAASLYDSTLVWKDLDWLRSISNLPIIIKGILTAEMAQEALKHSVDGIIVSNHGGRQLDGVLASIDALPLVVKAVDGKCEVYFDGGIRNGGDIAKAIALGAKAVFVGRPIIWGLACGGVAGARKVLGILRDEFELTMKLLGVKSISELQTTQNLVIHNSNIPVPAKL